MKPVPRGTSPVSDFLQEPPLNSGGTSTETTPMGTTPTHGTIFKRGFLGHRRKESNDLERTNRASGSSLMESLNLDHPLLDTRTSNSHTHSDAGGHSPSPSPKHNSLMRSRAGGKTYHKGPHGLDYGDVIFGLDKRASVRSDPGDRDRTEKGGSRLMSLRGQMGGSSQTSPTSSFLATEPINIPNSSSSSSSNNSPARKTQSLMRNTSLRGPAHKPRGGSGTGSVAKGNISLPKGPLYKEVAQPPRKVKAVGEFTFEYSGTAGHAEGYYRETPVNVSVLVHPALVFEQIEVSSSEK